MNEADARRVLLVRAVESAPLGALWTDDDRRWASRAAGSAPPERYLAERARVALERLLPRQPAFAQWLERRWWRPRWLVVALLGGFGLGLAVELLGTSQRIDLLSPPVLAVLGWNLLVYTMLVFAALRAALGTPAAARGLRRIAQRVMRGPPGASGPLHEATQAWAEAGAPLHGARAAAVFHAAAAALAAGLIAGLYARGLVLDYRAGWQSTFLEPGAVHLLLTTLLAPAAAVIGIALPGVEAVAAMRVLPGTNATAPAADWIHLFAALLALVVVLPRALFALLAVARAWRLARAVPLALDTPYFDRLLRAQRGEAARVEVLPYAIEPSPQAVLGLRAVMVAVFGDDLRLGFAPATAFGGEDAGAPPPAEPGTTLRVALFDLSATPEAEQQGRFVHGLLGAAPALLLVDESAFAQRFGHLPQRRDERRAAWQAFASAQGLPLVWCALEQPDVAATHTAVEAALHGRP